MEDIYLPAYVNLFLVFIVATQVSLVASQLARHKVFHAAVVDFRQQVDDCLQNTPRTAARTGDLRSLLWCERSKYLGLKVEMRRKRKKKKGQQP